MTTKKSALPTDLVAFMGIDPGAHGAIVTLDGSGAVRQRLSLARLSLVELWDHMRCWGLQDVPPRAVVEKVTGYTAGNERTRGSQMFVLGRSAGVLVGMLTAARIPFAEIVARRWQADLSLGTRQGRSYAQWKRYLRGKAEQFFPAERVTREQADAFLLALYCKRFYQGETCATDS